METFGVTPTEAAFEVIGLTNCKLFMDFIFKDTHLGLTAFLLGFLASLWQSVQRQNFQPLISFLLLFSVVWFIFIVPVSGVPKVTSTMENYGYEQLSANEMVLNQTKGQEVSPVLTAVSKFFNAIIIGAIKAVSVATTKSEYNYLKNPFFVNKVCLQMQRFAGGGIQDKNLKTEVAQFYYNHYLPVLSFMSKQSDNREGAASWWPGHEDVVRRYSSQGQEEWLALKSRLLDYIHSDSPWESIKSFIMYLPPFQGDSNNMGLEDRMIISLFDTEINKSAQNMASQDAYGTSKFQQWTQTFFSKFLGGGLALGGTSIWQLLAAATSAAVLKAFPYVEGYACLIMYSLFPFTLLLCLIFRKGSILIDYFRYLFWVKSWVLIWALIHYASLFMADIQASLSPGTAWLWERPYFNVVTSVFMIMTPIVAMYFVEGFVQGIGQVVSAITIHMDKAAATGGTVVKSSAS